MALGSGGARVLAEETATTFFERQLDDGVESCGDGRVDPAEQAMLWFHLPDGSGNDWVGHYGGMNGVATSLWLLPGDEIRYVVLMNESDLEALGLVEVALLDNAAPLLGD